MFFAGVSKCWLSILFPSTFSTILGSSSNMEETPPHYLLQPKMFLKGHVHNALRHCKTFCLLSGNIMPFRKVAFSKCLSISHLYLSNCLMMYLILLMPPPKRDVYAEFFLQEHVLESSLQRIL